MIRSLFRSVVLMVLFFFMFIAITLAHYLVTFDGSNVEPAFLPQVPVTYPPNHNTEGGDGIVFQPSSINYGEIP